MLPKLNGGSSDRKFRYNVDRRGVRFGCVNRFLVLLRSISQNYFY